MRMARKMAKVISNGRMEVNTRVNLRTTNYADKGLMYGKMKENILEDGKLTKCMERENLNGQMVEYTKETIEVIQSTDMEHTLGQMDENTKAIGPMENRMIEELTEARMVFPKTEFGKTEIVLPGCKLIKLF